MPIETRIHGLPAPEQIGASGIAVLAPGYRGRVTQLEAAAGASRAAGDPLPLQAAAAGAEAAVVAQLDVQLQAPPAGVGDPGRGTAAEEPRVLVPTQPGVDYAVLQTDESGRNTWRFPDAASVPGQAAFTLPESPPAEGSDESRGDVTGAMRRLVRVVAWFTDPLLGRAATAIARHWEGSRRPYTLRRVTREGTFVDPDWGTFTSDPALLLVHGTFSTPEGAFASWIGSPAFNAILDRYDGRCLAFGHPTLSEDPKENVEWLLAQLPADFAGPVDVVCHSRGGLVTRVLARDGGRVTVRRACQVGTPNVGTPLADSTRWSTFLDSHTNCLTVLPDSTTTIVLEGLLCLVKILGSGVGGGLPGLASMEPEGTYLEELAGYPLRPAQWYTVGASYGPAASLSAGFAQRAGDFVVDRFFSGANDLVVPTEGCHSLEGVSLAESLRLDDGPVHHCNYFGDERVQQALARWLV